MEKRFLKDVDLLKFDMMQQLTGTYYEGKIHLDKVIQTDRPLKVLVTFEEEGKTDFKALKLSDFSFAESRNSLKNVKGSFSDIVVDERRKAL